MALERTTDGGTAALSTSEAAQSLMAVHLDFEGDDTRTDSDAQERPEEEDTLEVEESEGEQDEDESEYEEYEEEDDSDGEEATETEAESEAEEPEQKLYTVKVDGEEVQVTFDELKRGYSRDSDYRRKTQALAEQRRAVEAENERLRQAQQQYTQRLEYVTQQMQAFQEPEPDWADLEKNDPIEYVRQKENWRDKREKQQALMAEQQRMYQMQEEERKQQLSNTLAQERERLLEAIPEWRDAEAMKADRERIIRTGKTLGFTEQELSQVYDHRAVVAIRKAALYDELMSKRKTLKPTAKQTTKSATPGTPQTRKESQSRTVKRKRQRLAKTGNVKDAAATIFDMIED
jgi:hypothetical protein